jgi:hypothetical protein
LGLLFQAGEVRHHHRHLQVVLMDAIRMILAVRVLVARMVSATSRTSLMEAHALMMAMLVHSISARLEAVLIRVER